MALRNEPWLFLFLVCFRDLKVYCFTALAKSLRNHCQARAHLKVRCHRLSTWATLKAAGHVWWVWSVNCGLATSDILAKVCWILRVLFPSNNASYKYKKRLIKTSVSVYFREPCSENSVELEVVVLPSSDARMGSQSTIPHYWSFIVLSLLITKIRLFLSISNHYELHYNCSRVNELITECRFPETEFKIVPHSSPATVDRYESQVRPWESISWSSSLL